MTVLQMNTAFEFPFNTFAFVYVGVGANCNRCNSHRQMRKKQNGFNENAMFAMGGGQFPAK